MPKGAFIKAIINGKYIVGDTIIEGKTLLFTDTILALNELPPPKNSEIIDAKGAYVSAGFIDIHIHGSGGADVMDATPHALETLSHTLPQTGTTAFFSDYHDNGTRSYL